MAKRRNRSIDDFLYSFLIGLMVSGNLLSRTHKDNTMSRLVYQTNEKHDSSWFDYILSLLGPRDRQENIDTRDNTTSIRMILSTR